MGCISVCKHPEVSLGDADQVARLIGCKSTVVSSTIDYLEADKLGRTPPPADGGRQRCIQRRISLSETSAGRAGTGKTTEAIPSD